ncbi:hypothetical protein [Labrys okinawensis]|uniref:hypothetical protein n=1 Tax=Labrys okinawensis TaxID=346911 RepID=UPI0011B22426|nr:hypothetical protein [Labrys okinawensis]
MIATASSPPLTFSRMRAVSKDILYIAAVPDGNEVGSAFTRLCQYNNGDWSFRNYDFSTESLALFKAPSVEFRVMYILSGSGEVRNVDDEYAREYTVTPEQVSDFKRKYRMGRSLNMRQIGDRLYVVGDGGQNFRREADGLWSPLDTSIFDPYASSDWAEEALDPAGGWDKLFKLFEENTSEATEFRRKGELRARNTMLTRVYGLSEDDIYLCGAKGAFFHWNGSVMRKIAGDFSESLTGIVAESHSKVWVCGRGGLLMVGNADEGFRIISNAGIHAFSSIAIFDRIIYLSSISQPRDLFMYDGKHFQRVHSSLTPGIEDVSQIDAVDGALWVMGQKDILRFDGTQWERIQHPENPPIGR